MKVKRVGTVTFGLSLISIGALFIVNIFVSSFSVWEALKFWPVILVMLGIEILVSLALGNRKNTQFKFDWVSMLLTVFMVLFSMAMAFADSILQNHVFEVVFK